MRSFFSQSCNWFESNSSTQKILVFDFILHNEEVRHTAMNGVLDLGESVQTHFRSKDRPAKIVDLLGLLNEVLEQ